jgi:hypothetical protein
VVAHCDANSKEDAFAAALLELARLHTAVACTGSGSSSRTLGRV